MVITSIYRLILLIVTVLIIRNMYDEKKIVNHIMGAMVIVPLILRLLMIK